MKVFLDPLRINRIFVLKKGRKWLAKYALKLQKSSSYQPNFSFPQIVLSGIGSFLGIAVLAYLTLHTHYPLIADPFGATAVILFAIPDSPLAQPRNVIGGNFLGGLTCIILVYLFGT
jgi:CBS-domain-containing membrane protein